MICISDWRHCAGAYSLRPILQHGEERLLRNLDLADLLHALLAFFLLLEELALAA